MEAWGLPVSFDAKACSSPVEKTNTNIVENYIPFLKYSCFWMENATHVDGLNPAKSAVFWWSLSTDFSIPFHEKPKMLAHLRPSIGAAIVERTGRTGCTDLKIRTESQDSLGKHARMIGNHGIIMA